MKVGVQKLIKNFSIGKYVPGDSLIHNLDTRTKLFISFTITILVFLVGNPIALGLVLISCICAIFVSKISFLKFLKSNIVILSISVFTTFLSLFFEAQSKLITSGHFYVTNKSLRNSTMIFLRLVSLIFMSSLLMYTTSSNQISHSIEKILKPLNCIGLNSRDIALTITITLRFLPIIFEEAKKILDAQKCRGASFKSRNIFKNIKSILSILVPLIVSAINRADDLAMALESRCYDGDRSHTNFKINKFKRSDIMAMVCTLILIVGVILCNTMIKI